MRPPPRKHYAHPRPQSTFLAPSPRFTPLLEGGPSVGPPSDPLTPHSACPPPLPARELSPPVLLAQPPPAFTCFPRTEAGLGKEAEESG